MTTRKTKVINFDVRQVLHYNRQLFLYGAINSTVANMIKQHLIAYDIVSQEPISLWISSPGGSCSAGLSIIEVMKKIESPVITIISGEVCSMASMISVCGDVRWAFKETCGWMQHPLSAGQEDYLPYIKDRTAYLIKYNEILTKIMKDHTKLSDSDYKKMEAGELWLMGEELIEKGIVDKLI